MGKTYRRDNQFKPKRGKDLGKFKKSEKWKKWDAKPHQHHLPENTVEIIDDVENI